MPAYDLLFDNNGDGTINAGDQGLTASELGRQCKNTGTNTGNERNWYNGDGLRVSAKTFPNGASAVTDDYIWDVGAGLPQILQDSRTQGGTTTTTTYLYGLGLIATTDNSGTASYYLADGLGSTTQLVDGSGSVTDTYTYDVFGALRSSSGSTGNPFDFAGQQTDHNANRGLQHLRARHYDPSLGRFLQRDPVPFAQRYSYAANDPVNRTDPTGLRWDWQVDAAAVLACSSGPYVPACGHKEARSVIVSGHAPQEPYSGVAYYDYCPGAASRGPCAPPGACDPHFTDCSMGRSTETGGVPRWLGCSFHYGKIFAPYLGVGVGVGLTIGSDGILGEIGVPLTSLSIGAIEGQANNPAGTFTPC